MFVPFRYFTVAVALSAAFTPLDAQAADPSGHWVGAIHVPDGDVNIEIDLGQMRGALRGTFSNASHNIKGFPLTAISVDGHAVTFTLKVTSGGGTFHSTLAADGKTIEGKFDTSAGEYSIPFTLTRNGDAKFEAPEKNAAVAKQFEGTWRGSLDAGRTMVTLVFEVVNKPEGTASASLTTNEGVMVPVASIRAIGDSIVFDMKSMGSTYSGSLKPGGAAIVGAWSEGAAKIPLTLERVPAAKK